MGSSKRWLASFGAALSLALALPLLAQGSPQTPPESEADYVPTAEQNVDETRVKTQATRDDLTNAREAGAAEKADAFEDAATEMESIVSSSAEALRQLKAAMDEGDVETARRLWTTIATNLATVRQLRSDVVAQTQGMSGGETGADEGERAERQKDRGDDLFDDEGPDIPSSQYIPEADRMLGEMRNELTKALDALSTARNEKDAVKLNYINEQVTNMKGILRISEDSYINLQEAMASNAEEKARYEFGKIRVSHRKMKELGVAVQNAKGAEASYIGGTQVSTEVNPALAGGDEFYGNQEFFNDSSTTVLDSGDDGVGGDDSTDARPQVGSPVEP